MSMSTLRLEKRDVVMDMAMKKSVKRGVDTDIHENRGVDMDVDTA